MTTAPPILCFGRGAERASFAKKNLRTPKASTRFGFDEVIGDPVAAWAALEANIPAELTEHTAPIKLYAGDISWRSRHLRHVLAQRPDLERVVLNALWPTGREVLRRTGRAASVHA